MEKVYWSTFLFLVYILGEYEAVAFTCFKCIGIGKEPCVEEPQNNPLGTVECDAFCTIVRTEYTDIPGEVVGLIRDCEKDPLVKNGVRIDKHYTKMYTSCNTNECNSGSGKRIPGEGDDNYLGPQDVIVVYESSSSWIIKPSQGIWTLAIILLMYNLY